MALEDVLTQLGTDYNSPSTIVNPSTRDIENAGVYQENRPSESKSNLITNVPGLESKTHETIRIQPTPIQQAPANIGNRQTDLTSQLFSGLQSQMDQITKIQDPLEKSAALSNLKGAVAESSAQIVSGIRMQAENQLGLSRMQQALREAERLDRADPNWPKYMTDSKITLGVRNELLRVQKEAGLLASRLIKENPTIAGMSARLDGFISLHEGLVNKSLSKEDKENNIINDVAMSLGPDTPKYLTMLMPGINNDPKKAAEVALQLRKDPNKKELAPFFLPTFSEADITPLAFAGNRPAQQLAVKVQSQNTGISPQQAEQELKKAHAFVNNESFFIAQMNELAKSDPSFKTKLSEYTQSSLMNKGKEADNQRRLSRMDLAEVFLTKDRTFKALTNVDNWNGDINLRANPEIAKTLDTLKTLNPNKPVSLETLISSYVSQAPKEQRADRLQSIRTAMDSYVEKNNKGLYGKLDAVAMAQRFKTSTGMSSAGLGSFINSFGDTMATYVNSNDSNFSNMGVR